jgi:hypothetical protein
VKWEKGTRADGLDSKAVQVADREHWPEMEALILIVCETEKDTPSTEGMQNSVATSPLLAYRAEHVRHMCSLRVYIYDQPTNQPPPPPPDVMCPLDCSSAHATNREGYSRQEFRSLWTNYDAGIQPVPRHLSGLLSTHFLHERNVQSDYQGRAQI